MSRDMAQRTTPVMIERAQYTATWEAETHALIDSRRWEIVGDCLALLRPDARPLSRYSRWGAWEAGVLSRVDDPAEAQKVIAERQADVDEDAGEAATVRDGFRAELLRRGHRPDAEAVRIPTRRGRGGGQRRHAGVLPGHPGERLPGDARHPRAA